MRPFTVRRDGLDPDAPPLAPSNEVTWSSATEAPISWFVGWLRKAQVVADVVLGRALTDAEIDMLFVLWLDGYSEDAAVDTVRAASS